MNRAEMQSGHLDDARCADLVLGLMPAAERERALAHAATCATCEDMLRAHVGAGERAWADAPGRAATGRVFPLPSRRVWVLAAAAALAVVFASPQFLSHGDRASNALLLPLPGAEVRTRDGGAEDPHLTAGLKAYAAHDFATAERELLAARAEGGAESMRRLYLAQVRMARGDARAAVGLLRGIEWRTVPEPWRRDGVTLLAHALRATGADVSADSIEHALRVLDPATPLVP
jgi:hypothetical protein